jgi:uncharacterized protein (DUF302 family)
MDNGIVSKLSPYSVAETLDRLEAVLRGKGIEIFARIDQKAEAEQVGLTLLPTQILLFGDPRTGTPLMNAHPPLALDLPLKALVSEAKDGQVWLRYNSPAYLQQRHSLPQEPFGPIAVLIDEALR